MDDRKAFEAYWSTDAEELRTTAFEGATYYCNPQTQEAWGAWEEAVKQEREAAAKVCEMVPSQFGENKACAAAIRARSVASRVEPQQKD